MQQKLISGHGVIVFHSHPYQMVNPKSILEMWLAGLVMAMILAIRQRWILNGMIHTVLTAKGVKPDGPEILNDGPNLTSITRKVKSKLFYNLAQWPSIFGFGIRFGDPLLLSQKSFDSASGHKSKSSHWVINYQRIFSETIRCYQPR